MNDILYLSGVSKAYFDTRNLKFVGCANESSVQSEF